MHQSLSLAVNIVALVILIGLFCFWGLFTLAIMSDLVGSGLLAVAILASVGIAVATIVLAAHRRQAATDPASILYDWGRSFAMALGAMLGGFAASFYILTLLLSMAEHRLLPAGIGSALLAAQRETDRTSILAVVWLAPQLCWIVSVALRIYRGGIAQAVDAFRLAVSVGLIGGLLLAITALIALILLGPPR